MKHQGGQGGAGIVRGGQDVLNGRTVRFAAQATAKDIFYCFRLLLGRYPHPEEWRGHAMRAGEELGGVVNSFARSLECSRLGLFRAGENVDAELTEIEGFRIFSSAGDALVGNAVRAGSYEPEICVLFRALLRPGMGVLDLGANIGFFSMLAATLVGPGGCVIAVEPNPRNVRLLEASRRINKFANVTVLQVAAGSTHGLLVLNTSYSNGTTSGLPDDVTALLAAETVAAIRLDSLMPQQQRIDLIKIDVEGAEYTALLGCEATIRRHRPVIITEFSPGLMPGISAIDGPGYLQWLVGMGYRLSIIGPDGTLQAAGSDIGLIMQVYTSRGVDHVDLLAEHGDMNSPIGVG